VVTTVACMVTHVISDLVFLAEKPGGLKQVPLCRSLLIRAPKCGAITVATIVSHMVLFSGLSGTHMLFSDFTYARASCCMRCLWAGLPLPAPPLPTSSRTPVTARSSWRKTMHGATRFRCATPCLQGNVLGLRLTPPLLGLECSHYVASCGDPHALNGPACAGTPWSEPRPTYRCKRPHCSQSRSGLGKPDQMTVPDPDWLRVI
jgi:hypothetical protein